MESNSVEEEVFLNFLILRRNRRKKKRQQWVRSISQNRETKGHYHALIQDMLMKKKYVESFPFDDFTGRITGNF